MPCFTRKTPSSISELRQQVRFYSTDNAASLAGYVLQFPLLAFPDTKLVRLRYESLEFIIDNRAQFYCGIEIKKRLGKIVLWVRGQPREYGELLHGLEAVNRGPSYVTISLTTMVEAERFIPVVRRAYELVQLGRRRLRFPQS